MSDDPQFDTWANREGLTQPGRAVARAGWDASRAALAYRADGSWSCTADHITHPCGRCYDCRQIIAVNLGW